MVPDGLEADPEPVRDRRVVGALGELLEDLPLAIGQLGKRLDAELARPGEKSDHPLGHARPEDRLAATDRLDRPPHLVMARVLEEITMGTRPHRREDRFVIGEHRQDQDTGCPPVRRDLAGRLDAVPTGHREVHQDDVGRT